MPNYLKLGKRVFPDEYHALQDENAQEIGLCQAQQ